MGSVINECGAHQAAKVVNTRGGAVVRGEAVPACCAPRDRSSEYAFATVQAAGSIDHNSLRQEMLCAKPWSRSCSSQHPLTSRGLKDVGSWHVTSLHSRKCRMATRGHARATVSDAPMEEYLEVAHALADVAAGITRRYFRSSVSVDTKLDESPVTIADREAEAAMREVIRARFPHHAIFGEEQGFSAGEDDSSLDLMWVIDPIDGTKSFITGKPLFGTLISLVCDGRPILGIIDQPILRERWVGVEGQRSTLNGNIIATRPCPTISCAYLYATTPHMFEGESADAFDRVRKACKIPMYGCDCYAYGLLAAGHCDLVVEADLKPYDYMALVPIIQGAGGIVTDWKGNQLGWTSMEAAEGKAPPGEIVAAGDDTCHRQVIELLNWR